MLQGMDSKRAVGSGRNDRLTETIFSFTVAAKCKHKRLPGVQLLSTRDSGTPSVQTQTSQQREERRRSSFVLPQAEILISEDFLSLNVHYYSFEKCP